MNRANLLNPLNKWTIYSVYLEKWKQPFLPNYYVFQGNDLLSVLYWSKVIKHICSYQRRLFIVLAFQPYPSAIIWKHGLSHSYLSDLNCLLKQFFKWDYGIIWAETLLVWTKGDGGRMEWKIAFGLLRFHKME